MSRGKRFIYCLTASLRIFLKRGENTGKKMFIARQACGESNSLAIGLPDRWDIPPVP
jgi:hypothetical protein